MRAHVVRQSQHNPTTRYNLHLEFRTIQDPHRLRQQLRQHATMQGNRTTVVLHLNTSPHNVPQATSLHRSDGEGVQTKPRTLMMATVEVLAAVKSAEWSAGCRSTQTTNKAVRLQAKVLSHTIAVRKMTSQHYGGKGPSLLALHSRPTPLQYLAS
eukprot:PhF_6_TR40376/c0_g1_i1/m.60123